MNIKGGGELIKREKVLKYTMYLVSKQHKKGECNHEGGEGKQLLY